MKTQTCTEALKTISAELKEMRSTDITHLRMALAQIDATAIMRLDATRFEKSQAPN